MSRVIDWSKALSDEDRSYLEERGQQHKIAENDRRFGKAGPQNAVPPEGAAPSQSTDDEEWADWVGSAKVDDLRAELEDRGLDATGHKADLQHRLIEAGR